MCTALPNGNALNGGLTLITGFARSLVYLELALEITAAVHPIDTGAVACDAQIQYIPNALPE